MRFSIVGDEGTSTSTAAAEVTGTEKLYSLATCLVSVGGWRRQERGGDRGSVKRVATSYEGGLDDRDPSGNLGFGLVYRGDIYLRGPAAGCR